MVEYYRLLDVCFLNLKSISRKNPGVLKIHKTHSDIRVNGNYFRLGVQFELVCFCVRSLRLKFSAYFADAANYDNNSYENDGRREKRVIDVTKMRNEINQYASLRRDAASRTASPLLATDCYLTHSSQTDDTALTVLYCCQKRFRQTPSTDARLFIHNRGTVKSESGIFYNAVRCKPPTN